MPRSHTLRSSNMKKGIVSAVLLACLSGCGPVYQKFYAYHPMRSDSQRNCSLTCQVLKQSCQNSEQQSYQLCLSNARLEYATCKAGETWGYSDKGKYECMYNCYCYEPSCSDPNIVGCEQQYVDCYVGCGGRVTETTRCVSQCKDALPDAVRELPEGSREDTHVIAPKPKTKKK